VRREKLRRDIGALTKDWKRLKTLAKPTNMWDYKNNVLIGRERQIKYSAAIKGIFIFNQL
jgi:hypothetical protein